MTASGVRVHAGAYLDSLLLMAATVTMEESPGVQWAGAVMATPRGLEELGAAGFGREDLAAAGGANDLVLAVRAGDEAAVEAALDAGWEAAFAERRQAREDTAAHLPQSIASSLCSFLSRKNAGWRNHAGGGLRDGQRVPARLEELACGPADVESAHRSSL